MNGHEHIQAEDLALFLLGGLATEEAAAVRAHAGDCALCTAELAQIRHDLGTYALAVEPAELPTQARERFMKKLGKEKRAVAIEEIRPKRRLAPVLAATGWAAVAAAAVVALGLRQDRDALRNALRAEHADEVRYQAQAEKAESVLHALTSPASVRVTLSAPRAPMPPAARATYGEATGTLLLQASNLHPLPPGKVYELWIIPANGSAPIPTGTFSPDPHGNGGLLIPSVPGATAAKAFGITAEPEGGSAAPTLPILLVGAPS